MTRRKEIEQQAMSSYPDCPERGFGTGDYEYPEFHDDEREAFIEGAEWADKTMIERVEQWLIKNNRGQTIGSLHRFLEEE